MPAGNHSGFPRPPSEFDYQRFLESSDSDAADHPLLFLYHRGATMDVFNAVFVPEMCVKVTRGNHEGKQGIIKCVKNPFLVIETKDFQTINVHCEEIQIDVTNSEKPFWTRYCNESTINTIVSCMTVEEIRKRPLYSFVQLDQYLEVVDENNPNVVETAQVLENRAGLLKLSYSGRNYLEYVHMASPRVKPLGWVQYISTDFRKSENYVDNTDIKGVPPFCFDPILADLSKVSENPLFVPFISHRFEIGHFVNVVDPETKFRFLIGIVTKIFNNYFFKISLLEDCFKPVNEWKTIIRNATSPDIFPFNQGHRDRCTTALPIGVSSYDKLNSDEVERLINHDSLELIQTPPNRFPILALVENGNVLFETDGETINDLGQKLNLSRQLIELYLDGDYSALHFGRILRVAKHFMFVSIETFCKFTPPRIISVTDENVFPFGYSKKFDIPVYLPFLYITPMLNPIKLDKFYTNNPFEDDGRAYLSTLWLNDDRWCPEIHVNRKCFCGPFIDKDKVWRLENTYGPGALPKVLESLISDLVTCCERKKLVHLLEAKHVEGAFPLPAKFFLNEDNDRQHSNNVTNFSFIGCKNVKMLPNWLNILCRTLDACPGFLNTKKFHSQCSFDCCLVDEKYAFMRPEFHVNTAYSLYQKKEKCEQNNKKRRRTLVEQLQSNSPRRKRSRVNGRITPIHGAEESDNDSRSSSPVFDQRPVQRNRTISSCQRPAITRPLKPVELSSDTSSDEESVIDLSSDEEIPTLTRQANVNELNQKNGTVNRRFSNSPSLSPSVDASIYHRPLFPRPAMAMRPLTPMRHDGPRIHYPTRHFRPLLSGPIMDPRKIFRSTPPAAPPQEQQIRFDVATGKYVTSYSIKDYGNASAVRLPPPPPPKKSPSISPTLPPQPPKAENTSPMSTLATGDIAPINSDPRAWRPAQVCAWLTKCIPDKNYSDPLFANRINGTQFLNLQQPNLLDMNIPLGPALKMTELIQKLRAFTKENYGSIGTA